MQPPPLFRWLALSRACARARCLDHHSVCLYVYMYGLPPECARLDLCIYIWFACALAVFMSSSSLCVCVCIHTWIARNVRVCMYVVCCSVLQCVAVCRSVLQCVAVCRSVLQCVAVRCSMLQCVAVRCSVLQCVAVCCSMLQYVAVCNSIITLCMCINLCRIILAARSAL